MHEDIYDLDRRPSAIETPFYTQVAILDRFVRAEDPESSPAALDVVLKALRSKPELRSHFFSQRPHPHWVAVLWDHGFFASAPKIETGPDGKQIVPIWDLQWYLASVANFVPEFVHKHLLTVPPEFRVGALHALRQLIANYPDQAATMVPVIVEWLEDRDTARALSNEVILFINELAQSNYLVTFELMSALLSPRASERTQEIGGYIFNAEAQSVVGTWRLRERSQYKLLFDPLRKLNFARLTEILESHLLSALRLEATINGREDDRIDEMTRWRSAIEATIETASKYKLLLLWVRV